jgi:hypothetical protein
MWTQPENDQYIEELHLAGEQVGPGRYRQIGSSREVLLQKEDRLPASLDGRVACYVQIRNTWSQFHHIG